MLSWLMVGCALFGAGEPLVVLDVDKALADLGGDSVLQYDALNFVASLQGVVNRDAPRLYLRFLKVPGPERRINLDDHWLAYMRQSWLKDREIREEAQFDRLFELFPEARAGVVLWDPEVPASSNVAATICGVEGWLPVRAGGALQARIVDSGPKLPVKLSLVGKFTGEVSGSRKCDAYLWAKEHYLDAGKCNPRLMAYYVDAHTQTAARPGPEYPDLRNACLVNHDYYIARRAFFWDLLPWGDEAPVDDPSQPLGTDRKTTFALLRAQYEQNKGDGFTSVGGFIPWNWKYTDAAGAGGKHGGVPTEWEYAAILSAHNAIMDADALGLGALSNASVYALYPLAPHYAQTPPATTPPLEDKTYVLVYMGDYDSAAWLARSVPSVWDDPARGSLPIAWAFNPNLSDRVPQVFDYVYATKTANDWFIGGDSGAGYLNPNLLTGDRLGTGLPDALEAWKTHCAAYYQRFDYSITGFVINGFHGYMPRRVQEAYASFSPRGVGMQLGYEAPLVNGTPFLRHISDIYPNLDDLKKTAAQMAIFTRAKKPQFLIFRWILQRASTLKAVRDLMVETYPEKQFEFCDPYTFFALYKESLEK